MAAKRKTAQTDPAASTEYRAADDSTAYFTLSLYADAANVARLFTAAGATGASPADLLTSRAMAHGPSRALNSAVAPQFNDIADREDRGAIRDMLLSTRSEDPADEEEALALARRHETIGIELPKAIRWTTEGRQFESRLSGLQRERHMTLQRYWMVHNNGALSYHLAFTACFQHDPADYYFLTLLQKLAAPKEVRLDRAAAAKGGTTLDPIGIDLIDEVRVGSTVGRARGKRFWPFVLDRLHRDAAALVAGLTGGEAGAIGAAYGDAIAALVDRVPVLDVPGLSLPKNRYAFMIHDSRLFGRLVPPIDPETNHPYRRKLLVQDGCFEPFRTRMREAIAASKGVVRMDDEGPDSFWAKTLSPAETEGLTDNEVKAILEGSYVDPGDGKTYHIPLFDLERTDCLDFLFMSGFNQNIIDFMNQDTSEILDGTDPIYPEEEDALDEGFFVRFANHRGMITYVPASRSLEIGNDYISTCPYAFLISAMAMHNEFLVRAYEANCHERIEAISAAIEAARCESDDALKFAAYERIESDINALRAARYNELMRYRHGNAFRYDTESRVFEKLEDIRGVLRNIDAIGDVVSSLEDRTADVERRQLRLRRERETEANEQRSRDAERTNLLIAMLGLVGLAGLLFDIIGLIEGANLKNAALMLWVTAGKWALSATVLIALLSLLAMLARRFLRRRRGDA